MIEHSENYFENWIILKEKEQLASCIREYITHTAKTMNLKVSFAPVRRKSDILLVKIRGGYKYAHNMSICLTENFSKVDIEIPESLQKDDYFTLIVTQKLAEQEIIVKERRAKLRKTLGVEVKAPKEPATPEELYDTLFLTNL